MEYGSPEQSEKSKTVGSDSRNIRCELNDASYVCECQFSVLDQGAIYHEAVDALKSIGVNFFALISFDPIGDILCHGRFLEPLDRLARVKFNHEFMKLANDLPLEEKFFLRSRKGPFVLEANPGKSKTVSERVLSFPQNHGHESWQSLYCVPIPAHSAWAAHLFGCKSHLTVKQRVIAATLGTLLSDFQNDSLAGKEKGNRALMHDELACIEWAAKGKTLQDIADILGISVDTVRYRLKAARERYAVDTNLELIARVSVDYNLTP